MINQQIQNYKIISLLGEGGMANVYLAEHVILGNKVAIKQLKDEFLQNSNIRNRFISEARNLALLNHPNIIKVTDFINTGKVVSFVMEYCEGITLEEYISKHSPLSNLTIESILIQMLVTINYVHEQGLVHRDIKPSNFMVLPNNSMKLLDFGIAKNLNDIELGYTKTSISQQFGTPLYMSPEQVINTSETTPLTDIYSLGVVLWQMVTNNKPYDTEKLTLPEIQVAIMKKPLQLTTSIWDSIIQKATFKNNKDRFQSCDEIAKIILQNQDITNDHNLKIGQFYQGGVIFKLDKSGKNGLVVSQNNFSKLNWEDALSFNEKNEISEYKDWYLPNKQEWFELYKNKDVIKGFDFFSEYWINEEVNNLYALAFSFINGIDFSRYKMSEYSVRLIRAF
jgi:serine/threonine protein kinase